MRELQHADRRGGRGSEGGRERRRGRRRRCPVRRGDVPEGRPRGVLDGQVPLRQPSPVRRGPRGIGRPPEDRGGCLRGGPSRPSEFRRERDRRPDHGRDADAARPPARLRRRPRLPDGALDVRARRRLRPRSAGTAEGGRAVGGIPDAQNILGRAPPGRSGAARVPTLQGAEPPRGTREPWQSPSPADGGGVDQLPRVRDGDLDVGLLPRERRDHAYSQGDAPSRPGPRQDLAVVRPHQGCGHERPARSHRGISRRAQTDHGNFVQVSGNGRPDRLLLGRGREAVRLRSGEDFAGIGRGGGVRRGGCPGVP
mmetsp:Transcript_3075/g.7810  ORF Transcript_3075/g.7810 Transcript_3075/m.7810 type:complete len:311 (-) Transcript_3075:1339-2271(-)